MMTPYLGLAGDDWITGGFGGDDVLTGGEGRDSFYVEIGNGITGGNDTITDFSPDDIVYFFNTGPVPLSLDIVYDGSDSLVIIGAGTPEQSTLRLVNYIAGPFPEDTVVDYSFGFNATPYGVVSNDTIVGDVSEAETIDGFAGDDLLIGVGGGDALNGGLGNDTLIASDSGGDHLTGGAGDDVLIGGAGSEDFEDFAGNDVFTGNGGSDHYTFYLGHGNDTVTDFGGGDALQIFDSFSGVFSISAEYTENDTILTIAEGTDQESTITLENYHIDPSDLPESGFAANRFSISGYEHNVAANDTLISSATEAEFLSGFAGNDLVVGVGGSDTLFGGVGNDTLIASNTGGDLLLSGYGNDVVEGGAQSDTFYDIEGDAVLSGNGGADAFTFELGHGNDTITDFGDGDVLNFETFSSSTVQTISVEYAESDTILIVEQGTAQESSVTLENYHLSTFELPEDGLISRNTSFYGSDFNVVSDDVVIATGDADLFGTAGDNLVIGGNAHEAIYAGAGNDTVQAGGGNDLIFGGEGNDMLEGGFGSDTFVFGVSDVGLISTGFGVDTITDFEFGDRVQINFDSADPADFELTQVGDDAILTIGEGSEYESQILFDDTALSADAISVTSNQLIVTPDYDCIF